MLLLVEVLAVVACSVNINTTLAQTIENRLFGLNNFHDLLFLNFYVGGKYFKNLDIFTWTKLEFSMTPNHLSCRHDSATDGVPPYFRSRLP
jgi:Na+/H+ antiporter NhaB